MKRLIFFILFVGVVQITSAQETQEWKTKTFVTGYFSLNGEYIDLPIFKEVKDIDKGIGLGEASVLTSIQPLEKLKINSVITYKPRLSIDGIIAELSGEWTFNDAFKLKAGRFVLPLHPANTQYYAPMNIGDALPIFVTNHSLFPLNINGVSFNGRVPLTDNLSVLYSFSGGQYAKISRDEAGILGFFGRDGVYLDTSATVVKATIASIESTNSGVPPEYFGAGGLVCFEIADFVKLGGAGFYSHEEVMTKVPIAGVPTVITTKTANLNYGVNLIADYNNIHLKGSAWFGNETPEDKERFDTYNTKLYFFELAYTINKFTPYVKAEIINGRTKDFNRASIGINYRPYYETTFKVEYHRYLQEYVDDFNLFQFALIYSF